ncbi:MAG: hypothetical protein A2X49_15930 [Lentisphaerae bacterium GWF2_52_8]|nr:MAG: hypothetical protein A2X49_15930 [Lentisphaerae bacterium GWF2_52_8]
MKSYPKNVLICAALVFVLTAFSQDSEFKTGMKNAVEKQNAKEYAEAQSLYRQALKQAATPDERQRAVRGIADCLNAQNKFVEAAEEIKAKLGFFEGTDATSNAYSMIIGALSRANEFKQALEWQNKRLAIAGLRPEQRADIYLQIGDMQKGNLQQLAEASKSYSEAIRIYDGIIADPNVKDTAKGDAMYRRVMALCRDESWRAEYLKAAEELLASSEVPLQHKISVLDQMKNVFISAHDWDKAAEALRKYAGLPGLSPSARAGVLLQLGDLNWRKRHNLGESLNAFREICIISDAPAKTRQDAETWIRMLSELY